MVRRIHRPLGRECAPQRLGYPGYPKPVTLNPTLCEKNGVLASCDGGLRLALSPAVHLPRRWRRRWTAGDRAGGMALIPFFAGGERGDRAMGDGDQGLERGGCLPTVIQRPSSTQLQYRT